jgi:hypothetical protein
MQAQHAVEVTEVEATEAEATVDVDAGIKAAVVKYQSVCDVKPRFESDQPGLLFLRKQIGQAFLAEYPLLGRVDARRPPQGGSTTSLVLNRQ